MANINFKGMRDRLSDFKFQRLFIEDLGWSQPPTRKPMPVKVKDSAFILHHIAELGGVVVLEATAQDGQIPDAKLRGALHKEVAKQFHENLLIFVDDARSQSLWYWIKRQDGKQYVRDHLYVKGQPGELFLSKLGQIVFDFSDLDESGDVSVVEVAARLRKALDVERVTKKFYGDFSEQHLAFLELIHGIPDEGKRRWYASVLLNRLMFIYFLQRKGFINNGQLDYLQDQLRKSQEQGNNRYFREFLKLLFFEGFAKPEEKRTTEARKRLGKVRYLNGGLFLPHQVEEEYPELDVPDRAFKNLFALFEQYSWNLNDTPGGNDNEINPDVLGYIFEKYINQKAFGAYYTRPEITEYLCERTIHCLILDAVNTPGIPGVVPARKFETLADLLLKLDAELCRRLLLEVLPKMSLLDPACGSGAFLVAAMKTLINVYAAIIGKIKFLKDATLSKWLADAERAHASLSYYIKKTIITDNLYGVDIMEEAVEIAKLRLFLALVASAENVDQLEPLPNIDFSLLAGNSLVGLTRVEGAQFESHFQQRQSSKTPGIQKQLFHQVAHETQGNLFRKSYQELLLEKNRLIDNYRHASLYADDLTALRHEIEAKKKEAGYALDEILLEQFQELGIKHEQATWNTAKNEPGKPIKRPLTLKDIAKLSPFHWGYEFDEILHKRGGFDAIITNPPWEIFKPNGKEFFEEHSELVSKKKMTIKEFEKEQAKLLKDEEIRTAWLEYLSSFPHLSGYFRNSSQYKNQISIVHGKKIGSDINYYKLFVELCFNLLRPGGRCGMVCSGGITSDLGAKQLREILFSKSEVDSLFGFSNERYIFEGVHHSQKLCILVFEKGGETHSFPAAFRMNPREAVAPDDLEGFFHEENEHVRLSVPLIRQLSPDSLSVVEFRNNMDVEIIEKMHRFPMLGDEIKESWKIRLIREFDMTLDSHLFKEKPDKDYLPLYEGKMIHQFTHQWENSLRYWIDEKQGRAAILGKAKDIGQILDYQTYRAGFRKIARTTDVRTLIAAMLPKNLFCSENFQTILRYHDSVSNPPDDATCLYLVSIWNSFVLDYAIRFRVGANVNFFYVYQLPVPRLKSGDAVFGAIVERAARLTCTTPEFDELAKEVGLKSYKSGVVDPIQRAELRAELDGIVAHLYGLTEAEFAHVLTTFPLVPDPVKIAAQNALRDVERGLIR